MLKYHHLGIPTKQLDNGTYLPHLKMTVSGYDSSQYHIEWMKFDEDCPLPELVKTVPHVAFEVEDLQQAIHGKKVIIPVNQPSEDLVVAFIEENGAPIEFLQYLNK
ncbi:MAG: hypothetical protein OEZ58_09445 [Gammaproteobacteria bacterium]|nr:hypothetical protein [Gammaproteobacteria bacterium]MDH5729202.1 hypothetical protein [Gammaproteobacteria bacterium]